MLNALARRIDIMAQACIDPIQLVCRNGSANARAADKNPAVCFACQYRTAEFCREVGVIDGIGAIRTEVQGLVTFLADEAGHFPFQRKTCVVASNSNTHM